MCEAWLRLWRTPGVGPGGMARVLEAFPDPEAFLAAPLAQRRRVLPRAGDIPTADDPGVRLDLDWLAADQRRGVITLADPRYPASLRALASPPPVLYAQGDLRLLERPQLGIVGSRKPTRDGQNNARGFARHLAATGIVVTSGLALGIDAAGHRGALEAGTTIAVTATGLDRIYPAGNASLASEIADSGLIITEHPVGTGVRREHFPRRNRLISGLSTGVLVVEAGVHSGSLITAQHALEQGREVFAIPGSIHNPLARGCHHLIREGAKLVECLDDILVELPPIEPVSTPSEPAQPEPLTLDAEQQAVVQALGDTPQPTDVLAEQTGLTLDTLSSILLLLEFKDLVEPRPGGRYVRVRGTRES